MGVVALSGAAGRGRKFVARASCPLCRVRLAPAPCAGCHAITGEPPALPLSLRVVEVEGKHASRHETVADGGKDFTQAGEVRVVVGFAAIGVV